MRAQQSPQQVAYVQSLVALAKVTHWRSFEDDSPIVGSAGRTECFRVVTVSSGLWDAPKAVFNNQTLFDLLAQQWRADTAALSSTTEIVMSAPYQTIIGMGAPAIPMILRELESELEAGQPDNWFWALRFLTRENPVRSEDRGNRKAMAAAWVDWARWRYVW